MNWPAEEDGWSAGTLTPDRLVHGLSRTAVRNLERAGVPRSVATKRTGHETEALNRRYAIVPESDVQEAVATLAKLHGQSAIR